MKADPEKVGGNAMSGHHILLVEDNPATRRMVTFALERRGHRVWEAPDGRSAMELTERHQPVVVLQDLVLPDCDGFALLGELRKRSRGPMAVLAFSGFASRNDEARISAVGFDDVIVKPIEPSRLVPIVEAHLPSSLSMAERFGVGRRLVVADDDATQLKLTRFRMEKLGFEVHLANDGREALAIAERVSPDAIVSDVLMPQLDGFGLSLAIRQSPTLAHVPILLVTSSYVDESDRDLARRAGANDLILRTPDHREVLHALRMALSAPVRPMKVSTEDLSSIEGEHGRRLVHQLERQVLVNSGLSRRTSALSAELSVLAGISQAVLKHANIEAALDDALAACFDAGGISTGALYLMNDDNTLRARPLGSKVSWQPGDLESFFGHESLLREILTKGTMVKLPSPHFPARAYDNLLRRCGSPAILVVPLVYVGRALGALFMAADADELDHEDWSVFAQGVGNQIAQALAVAQAFAQREAAEIRARDQERLAREQSDLLQMVLENAPDQITWVDRAGLITFVNRAVPPLTCEQLVGTPWLNQIPSEYHEALSLALRLVVMRRTTSTHEIVVTHSDGRMDWYSIRIGPVVTDGVPTGAVVMSRPITEEKQREARLIVTDRMASIGSLAAGVAHEINNPLAAVIANVDCVYARAKDAGDEVSQEYLRDILDAAERVRLIVRDLKVFSRSEEDAIGPVDVRVVLESTLRMAWNEIRHRAQLIREFDEVPLVEGNESRLGQVFLNLVINAAQSIGEGHADDNEIRVSTRVSAGMVAIAVADTGAGMSEEVQRRLFTPFFTTKATGEGTGLGLSICQRIVSGMRGEIRMSSRQGKGTTFTVLLPPSTRVAAPPFGDSLDTGTNPLRRGRILIVDDDRAVMTALRRALGTQHDVTETLSAIEALALIRGGATFDLILCDLMMPQMTGMDLYAELATLAPDQALRMVFVTGGAFTDRARTFLESAKNPTVEKPFSVRSLRMLVDERLERFSQGPSAISPK